MIREAVFIFSIGIVGCSFTNKRPSTTVEQPLEGMQETRECQKKYGSNSEPFIISKTEFVCRIHIEDPDSGLSKLYNNWRFEARQAKGSKAPLSKINKDWEASARKYGQGKCPYDLVAHPVPLNNKIVCNSMVIQRNVIQISPESESR